MRVVNFPYTHCQFGVAVRDTTPPAGIYMRAWGAATHDVSDGVHRPHFATAALFAPLGGGEPLALVALDIGWFQNPGDEQAIRDEVMRRSGLTSERLLLNLSHTHASVNANSTLGERPGGHLLKPYLAQLADQVAGAVLAAKQAMAPAWIAWGYGHCGLAVNRDYWDAEQRRWACGFNPERTPDDTLLVARVTGSDGRVRATMYNYACHPTTLAWQNHVLSPDFIGAARELLERAFDAPALFLQGALGDQAPRDNYVGDTAIADRNGRQLGYAAAGVIEGLPPAATRFVYQGIVASGADLGTWAYEPIDAAQQQAAEVLHADQLTVDLPRKAGLPTIAELEQRLAAAANRRENEIIMRQLLLERALGTDPVHHMPLWVWRLGQAVLVAICNEPYSVVQQTLRQRFPGVPVVVMGVTNRSYGYLPPRDLFGKGIYQEQQSPYAAGCMELTVDGAVAGIARMLD
jgi:hypothetical protein